MIGVLIFPDFQLLDAAGPIAAFEIAARFADSAPAIRTLAAKAGPVRSSSGVEMLARGLRPSAAITTLIIAGGNGVRTPFGAYRPFATGEFLLGHRDDANELAGAGAPPRLIQNGTYVVYRKLEQDVFAFRHYVNDTARWAGESPEFIAAKLMGRWQNGLPLAAAMARRPSAS